MSILYIVPRRYRDNKEIIFLFPFEIVGYDYREMNSYMKVGQHGAATREAVMSATSEAGLDIMGSYGGPSTGHIGPPKAMFDEYWSVYYHQTIKPQPLGVDLATVEFAALVRYLQTPRKAFNHRYVINTYPPDIIWEMGEKYRKLVIEVSTTVPLQPGLLYSTL